MISSRFAQKTKQGVCFDGSVSKLVRQPAWRASATIQDKDVPCSSYILVRLFLFLSPKQTVVSSFADSRPVSYSVFDGKTVHACSAVMLYTVTPCALVRDFFLFFFFFSRHLTLSSTLLPIHRHPPSASLPPLSFTSNFTSCFSSAAIPCSTILTPPPQTPPPPPRHLVTCFPPAWRGCPAQTPCAAKTT